MKQMAVLNLNDIEHIPHGRCFLTSSLLFQSSVRNQKKLQEASGIMLERSNMETLLFC